MFSWQQRIVVRIKAGICGAELWLAPFEDKACSEKMYGRI